MKNFFRRAGGACIAVVIVIAAAAAGCTKKQSDQAASTEISSETLAPRFVSMNAPAPDFTLKNRITGEDVKLSAYRGRVVMVNFWAPWCPPCREELPDLVGLYEANRGKGFELLGVFVSGDPGEVDQMVRQHGIDYPVLTGDESVARAWLVNGIPTTYIIDREGVVRVQYVGAQPRAVFEQDVMRLLNN
ncbi:MAG TPA: TlpA disulfide reductase family protein [Candidatus Latescibacteria bacterium]|nr:TlpA disulfide reductase family protein [Candidatus Latescibacterota bacterium]